jgi:parallel beta-helix repeat protein
VENKEGNRLSSYGIFLEHSSNNTISGNNASYNAHGIWINHSNGNKIYLNTFNNTQNAWSNSSNTWNSITKVVYRGNPILVGNCWSDYTGTDSNGDGIGDLPYNISGGSEKDKYPIMTRIVGLGPSKSLDEVCKAVVIKVGKPASSEKFASRSDMGIDDIYYLHLDIGGEGYHKKGYSTDGTITTWGFEHALNVNAQDKSSQPPYEPIPMLIQVQAWVSNPPYPFTDHIADYITMQNAPLTDKNVDEISRVIKKGGKVGLWIDDQFEDEIKKLAKCLDTTPTYSNNSSSGCIDEFKDCAGFSKICMEDRR